MRFPRGLQFRKSRLNANSKKDFGYSFHIALPLLECCLMSVNPGSTHIPKQHEGQRQTDRQTDRQADRQTNRETDRETY